MADAKELRSIELTSYTIMSTAITVVFAVIIAIIFSIGIGVSVPNGLSVVIYLIPTIVVGCFMYSIYNSFCEGMLYNVLAKRLKTIAVEINGDEITKISTAETAIMASIIATIQVILIYLVSVLILPLLLSTMMQTLMYAGQDALAYSIYQLLVVISQPATVGMIIFGTLIITFVFVLLGTYVYNYIAQSGRGISLKLSNENGYTAIDSVDCLKFAIAFAIISVALNLILSIIMVVSGMPIATAVGNVIGGLVGGFVEAYIIAFVYNYLAPKLGKLKIELIDM